MLATQLNEMMTTGEMDNHCVVKVKQYICNTLQGDRYVLFTVSITIRMYYQWSVGLSEGGMT